MSARVEFWVAGQPAAQGSKRHVGGGRLIESSKAVGPWRERVALVAHDAMRKAGNAGPFMGPVTLLAEFVLYRPKSAPKTKPVPATKKPDADKCLRAVGDALSKICYADDSQIVDIRGTKRVALPGEEPGARITVTEGESTA